MKVAQTIWIFWLNCCRNHIYSQIYTQETLKALRVEFHQIYKISMQHKIELYNILTQIMRKILLPILKFCRKVQEYFHEFKVFSQAKTESITLKVSIIIFPQTLNSIADSLPSYHPVFAIIYNNVRWTTFLAECTKLHNEAKLVKNVT